MPIKMNSLTRSIVVVCLIDGLVGLSFGASAAHLGIDIWVPFILALTVLAGASEFLFVSIVAVGGNPITAALAGLLVNVRHLPFAMLVKNQVGNGWKRAVGSHLMNDESVAFAVAQSEPKQKKYAYWLCGIGILMLWPSCILIGGLFSDLIIDPHTFGLDALFPCLILALVIPFLTSKTKVLQALLGSSIAVLSTPFLVAGLPALLALTSLGLIKTKKVE